MHGVMRKLIIIGVSTFSISGYPQQSESSTAPTVAATLEALRSRASVQISIKEGWTIVSEPETQTQWIFTPPGHPAHPAAIKRTFFKHDGGVHIGMSAMCQAEKAACDRLISEFQVLNEKLRESVREYAPPGAASGQP